MTSIRLLLCFVVATSALNIVSFGGTKAEAASRSKLTSPVQTAKSFEAPSPVALAEVFAHDNDHALDDIEANPYQQVKDVYLAAKDRKAWCADRCLATGHCDVLEDLYELTTTQVMKFCSACAGSEECELSYAN